MLWVLHDFLASLNLERYNSGAPEFTVALIWVFLFCCFYTVIINIVDDDRNCVDWRNFLILANNVLDDDRSMSVEFYYYRGVNY